MGSKEEEPAETTPITWGKFKWEVGENGLFLQCFLPHSPKAGHWGISALRALRTTQLPWWVQKEAGFEAGLIFQLSHSGWAEHQ